MNDIFKTLCNRAFVGDIEGNAYNAVARLSFQVGDKAFEFFARKVGGGQVTAGLKQTPANAVTDGTGGAGYQGNFILKR